MNRKKYLTGVCVLLGLVGVSLLGMFFKPWMRLPAAESAQTTFPALNLNASEAIGPLPLSLDLNPEVVSLGKQLFHDPRLSRDNSVSCASCHDLKQGGMDRLPHSRGLGNALGEINAPTVFNSGLSFKQFWDGRASTLEEQINGPIHDPREMGTDWNEVMAKLSRDAAYRERFRRLYKDGMQPANIRAAIAIFERSLITPNSRFDQFLRGNEQAIQPDEKEGYHLFLRLGCVSCHQGILLGGNMFETFGVMGDYFADRGSVTQVDLGRFNVTGLERDRYKFKVPSLRNVELTAPYFHDGSAATLEMAIAVMVKYQLGREISGLELSQLVQFLKTLTGEYEGKPLRE